MPQALIELIGEDVFCSVAGEKLAELRLSYASAGPRLRDWAVRYDRAAARDQEAELAAIGREMFAWLDAAGWASSWADGSGDRALEIRVRRRDDPRELALLDAPWELLARDTGPLTGDALQPFSVARRVGEPASPWEPQHADLQLMFMAAAPEGQAELDYEQEEASILAATRGNGRVHVIVEETGALNFLAGRLASEEGPFETVHLSCHGDIDAQRGPVLLLETAEGIPHLATAADIVSAMGTARPPLVVLSACRTAETGRAATASSAGRRDVAAGEARELAPRPIDVGAEVALSFARQLTTQVPNVVGWDGSVYDRDAIDFAQSFYGELGRGEPVPRAAAAARRVLLEAHGQDRQRGRHWHLARVYLGPQGGGPLSMPRKPRRRTVGQLAERAFLDKDTQRVPVATRAEFVGRRRAIQKALRAFAEGHGVVVHGMGALGESSLAARVVSRTPREPVVIFERYDALAIFDKLLTALKPADRLTEGQAWREQVKSDPACLGEALESWLEGPLDATPILLVIDDLERILDTPRPDSVEAAVEVAADYRAPLGAVLRAFAQAQTASRLLLTSRYDIRHADGAGRDLASGLVRVPLTPMPQRERVKQLRAAERLLEQEDTTDDMDRLVLLGRALDLAAGNPGLQAILTRPVLAGEPAAAAAALAQIASYRQTGVPPAEIQALMADGTAKDSANAVTVFFARLSFETYRAALTGDQARQLTAALLFMAEVPIPLTALQAAGAALGVEDAAAAVRRLLALGLLDDFGKAGGEGHAAINPLARPLAPGLDPADRPRLAHAALPWLIAAWRDDTGGFPADPRGAAAAEVALEAGADAATVEAAALAGGAWLARAQGETRAALALVERCLAVFPAGHAAGPGFLRLGAECADSLGEAELQDRLLGFPVRRTADGDSAADRAEAALDLRRADRLVRAGDVAGAETLVRAAQARFQAVGDARAAAIAAGQIADILQGRGETEEALRIHREEELPVYERLGEVRERAVTMGQIADILQARGETDEALRIRREEQLPVFERLGDVRSRAATMGKIADILQARGETEEALRIHRAEELPVYERLGDVRSRAVTMGQIADILQARGKTDEALRIRREELLPVYERLGDVRSRAVTLGKIADILRDRGEIEEALRIRREEQLPVFERLGDVRSRAVVMGKIADILQGRGETDEALRIHREEELPVYERLGDVRSRAVTMGQIADILRDRGETDEALRIRREEQLPVFERLGDVRERAATMGKIADILHARGETEEALRIRREEELPVYERLGEVRERAVAMGQIADILHARGEIEEALRIRREEELPIYERLGDVRSRAITMGQIADILHARGETDEALRIRREEELPAYERLGDVRSRAVTLQQIAGALIAAGGLENGRIQEIADALGESFNIAQRLGLPDGIGFVGLQLAQVLARGGLRKEALTVLDLAEAAFRKLGNAEAIALAAKFRDAIRASE